MKSILSFVVMKYEINWNNSILLWKQRFVAFCCKKNGDFISREDDGFTQLVKFVWDGIAYPSVILGWSLVNGFLYPLVMTNIAIEHGPCIVDIYLFRMAIFQSYCMLVYQRVSSNQLWRMIFFMKIWEDKQNMIATPWMILWWFVARSSFQRVT